MYVAVAATVVATARKETRASEDTTLTSQSQVATTTTIHTNILQDRTPVFDNYGRPNISFRDITSPQQEQVMCRISLYEGSSSYLNRTLQRLSQVNNTPRFQRDCVTGSDKLARGNDTDDHVKETSESAKEFRNLRHKTRLQQEKTYGTPYQNSNIDTNFTLPVNTHVDGHTEFSRAHDRVFTQEAAKPKAMPEFHHKLALNTRNKSLETGVNKNISESSESSASSSPQRLLDLLIQEDDELNKTLAEAWNYTETFLNFGDLNVGQEAINLTHQYVARRRVWIGYMCLFSCSNKNVSQVLLGDSTSLQARTVELGEVESIFGKLQYVHRVAAIVKTDEINILTYCDMHNYSAALALVLEAEAYLNDWEAALRDVESMWQHYSLKDRYIVSWNNSFQLVSERKVYLETMNVSIHKDYSNALKKHDLEIIFQYYVYPIVYLVILLLGVVGNGALLLMFVNCKEIRTAPNIMIFNLALADIMNLFANAPLYYVSKYYSQWIFLGGYGCRAFVTFRFLNHTIIELSVVALSAQRYCAAVATLRKASKGRVLSSRSRTVAFVLAVWLIALVFSLPPSVVFDYRHGVCFPLVRSQIIVKVLDIFYFVFFCFVLPITMTVFSVMTARKLRQSVRDIPGELRSRTQEAARYRSAHMVTALAVSYAVSHIPRSIWFFLMSFYHLDRREMKYIYVDEVTNYLIFSNSCLNPLALYIASGTFRRLFRRYLFCVTQNRTQRQCLQRQVTASSSTQLVFFIDVHTGDVAGSQASLKGPNIPRIRSEVDVNVHPSV
jgi:hypothetical protein